MRGEEELRTIGLARSGDRDAFGSLVRRYSRRVNAIAYQIVGNSEDAKDIAQDVFVRIHGALSKFDPGRGFSSWLYRVTVNLAIDRKRKDGRRSFAPIDGGGGGYEVEDRSALPDAHTEHGEFKGAVGRLTACLTDKQRRVFVLRDLQGFSVGEISEILGCRTSTVRVHLARARNRMREALADLYPEYAGGEKHEMQEG